MSVPRFTPPPEVLRISRRLEEAGFETWAVGGAIRDALLGHDSGDWDLATRAHPERVRSLFRRTVPIGIEHGTVGVLGRDGALYEVTTFRKDVETDGRHAVVAFADTIEDDLARRDFTINAVAWHPIRDEVFDPFDGATDLGRRLLRTVGDPDERFREDYLRTLRAMRFAGRFEMAISPETWTALGATIENVTTLSPERIRDELLKILSADRRPARALSLYRSSGALEILYPELAALDDEDGPRSWFRTLEVLEQLPTGRPHLRLAALVRPLESSAAAAVLLRLRLSNAATDEIASLAATDPLPVTGPAAERPAASAVRSWLSRNRPHRLTAAVRLQLAEARVDHLRGGAPRCGAIVEGWRGAKEVVRSGTPLSVPDLDIDGRRLIALGLRPGPHFGTILDTLLARVIDDPERNRAAWLDVEAVRVAEELRRE